MPSDPRDVIAMLRAAHLDFDVRMTDAGGELTLRFTDYCQIHCALTQSEVELSIEELMTLNLLFKHGYTHEQVAERMRCSDRTVRNRLYRAAERIAQVVELDTAPKSWV